MTRFGLDSVGEVPVWAHHAVGSSVALRYLSRDTSKVPTRQEHARYKAAGIDLVLVFEDGGRPDLRGYDGGKADAEYAIKQATDRLGAPPRPYRIRFAADYDPAGHPEATDAYYDGIRAVIPYDSGPYAGKEILTRQADRGFKVLWQTYAWSGTPTHWDSRANVRQDSNNHVVGGVGVDFNHLDGADFGQVDYRPPVVTDPYHYDRFPAGPFAWKGRNLHERDTVLRYDGARKHPVRYRKLLGGLRRDLKDLADRVYFVAHQDLNRGSFDLPPTWGAYWRGWRYQQLIKRSQGARLA